MLGEDDQEFRVDFMIAQSSGNHTLIGSDAVSLDALQGGKNTLNIKGQKVQIERFELKPVVSFLEYIFGGCQINLHVAVDFTASNGPQDQSDSLHNRDPNRNQYLQALKAVGGILQYYDQDKMIPAYGFGAQLPNGMPGSTFHKFALNGDAFKPECNGIDGVEQAYHRCLQNVRFYGPTNFSEIISTINDRCEAIEVSQ